MRKNIACIIIRPETSYQQRVMDGLLTQCRLYGYNLSVFSPLVDISHNDNDYLNGELNILNLVDYNSFDGIVIVPVPFVDSGNTIYVDKLYSKISAQCNKPIVTLDYRYNDHPVVYTDDTESFRNITRHLLDVHKCEKIYFLTGTEGFGISEMRLEGFLDVMKKRNKDVGEDCIFYGDFWYTSGEELAGKIISGEVEKPDAIICASDHMAIGAVRKLKKNGFKIPEDIIVTGHDATPEAILNFPSITSYIPSVARMAADGINKLRSIIEPGEPLEIGEFTGKTGFLVGESCGCSADEEYNKEQIDSYIYHMNRNCGDKTLINNRDIGILMESYMFEILTQAKSPLECLKHIYSQTYLLEPYGHFYLCLRPDWLDTEVELNDGYPEKMRCVIHSIPDHQRGPKDSIHCRNHDMDLFDTKLMIPELWKESDEPRVFYFAPVHFSKNTLGYCVLVSDIKMDTRLTCVFRNWIRNINNALEMIRIQNRFISYSLVDSMTKLNNRRGMEVRVNDLLSIAEEDDMVLAMVIDMDGLKHINDTYGHNEGDYAIMTIASVVRCITEGTEICSRAGGDEFYILGIGKYTEESVQNKVDRFYSIIFEQNKFRIKPFEVTGSVGFCIKPVSEIGDISELIAKADSSMYTSKVERKRHRE